MRKKLLTFLLALVTSVGLSWATTTDLASITDNYTAQDGEILTGTLGVSVKISIADGATVTLLNANINGDKTLTTGAYAGLTCLGDATITIVGTNSVSGYNADNATSGFPGIYVPSGKTLIINGTGSLTAQSSVGDAAGIGAGGGTHCGNIVIQSGKITAKAGAEDRGAGIGGAYNANCGNITISGGIVTADGGYNCPGIGGGRRKSGSNAGHCGNILISGGVVSATSGEGGAAIGSGQGVNSANKTNCGTITITNTALKVYAHKGGGSANTIGAGKNGTCGTVTIGGNTGVINDDPYTYQTKEDGEIVVDYINAIGTVVYTQECKDKIDIARELYDALEDSKKALITDYYQTLLDAEAAYAALIPQPTPTPSGDGDKLAGAFSVGGDKVVYFSKANLQATTADNGATWTWGFAENQWDYVGNSAANNAINGGGTVSANGPVDLFAWSSTANNYFGINNSLNEADYSGDFKDWGAKKGSDWRTLTINEWQYLLQERNPGSSSANHTSYPRYTNAQILTDGTAPQKDIKGIILFPDDFNDGGESIDGVTWGSINPSFFSSDPTYCTTAGWATLESMGCVFLPSAGSRQNFGDEFAILEVNQMGNYWSSTLYSGEPEDPQSIAVGGSTLGIGTSPRYFGMSVRLVSETAPSGGSTSEPAAGIPCTAADLGKVLCTDGSIYATVSEATAASKTAAAVIAYVDTENNKGLALALENESGTMDWETAKTTAAAHTPAVSGGTWTLASKDDWDHMINAAGSYNALRDGFSGVGGTNIQKGQYWTSTEYDSGLSLVLNFGTNDGGYFVGMNEDPCNVRACLAFDISATPTPSNPEIKLNANFGGTYDFADTEAFTDNGDGTATLSNIALEAGYYYNFRVKVDGVSMSDNHEFTRQNPSCVISSGSGDVYYFQADVTGNYSFTWEYATNTLTIGYPEIQHTYTAVGQNLGVFGNSWDPSITANDLVLQEDGSYKWEKENVSFTGAITIQYRVCEDHAWNVVYPATSEDAATFEIPSLGDYKITITYNPVGNVISASAEKIAKPTIQLNGNFSGEWADTEAFEVSELPMHSYAKLTKLLEPGTYEFGVKVNGEWRANGSEYTRDNYSYVIEEGHTGNLTINVDVKGYYSFFWYYDDNRLTIDYSHVCGMYWKNVTAGNFEVTLGQEGEVTLPKVWATSGAFVSNIANGVDQVRLGSTDETVATIAYTLSMDGLGTLTFHQAGECDIYVVHDITNLYCYDSCAFHLTVHPAAPVVPVYTDADFAIDFRNDPYQVTSGSLPTGTEVEGTPHSDISHGYTNAVITIPVTAGNYLVKMGTCKYSGVDGAVKTEDGSYTYATLATNNGTCYHQNTATNVVSAIFNVPTDQIIKVYGAQYTPYFAIEKMAAVPAFTDFEINFQTDPYDMISGAKPEGTVIAGSFHDGQHGYQNVEATVPMQAGTYRLTLGACGYGNGAGNVMSETNVELAAFNQKLEDNNKCYHQDPANNIVSMIFTVDIDQTITIDCGEYTPYMKLEKLLDNTYYINFENAEGAIGTVPSEIAVAAGDSWTIPANLTLYKEGYTFAGWSDGVNTYAPGDAFYPSANGTLHAVYTPNSVSIADASTINVKWYFGESNGAPSVTWNGAAGYLLAKGEVDGQPIDLKLDIDATASGAKFDNNGRGDKWAQVNNGTVFTFPSKEGAVVNVETYSGNATYDLGDGTLTCNTNDYYSYLEITYTAPTPTPTDEQVVTNEDPENPGTYYYSTFFHSTQNYALTNDGTEAFIADLSGNDLVLTKIAEGTQVIPANTAVILRKSGSADPVVLDPTDEPGVSFSANNDLQGVDVATNLDDLSIDAANCYVLSGKSHDGSVVGVGFYRIYGNTLKAHKAFVIYNGTPSFAPKRMRFVFENEQVATGVENTNAAVESQKLIENGVLYIIRDGVRYNVQGQKVK